MAIPNEHTHPDTDWNEVQKCGHTLRYHKEQFEQAVKAAFGMNIEEFNRFSVDFKENVGISFQVVFVDKAEDLFKMIATEPPEEIRKVMIETITDYLDKTVREYFISPTIDLARRSIFLAQRLEKDLGWSLKTYRIDLHNMISHILIGNWREIMGNQPMP